MNLGHLKSTGRPLGSVSVPLSVDIEIAIYLSIYLSIYIYIYTGSAVADTGVIFLVVHWLSLGILFDLQFGKYFGTVL